MTDTPFTEEQRQAAIQATVEARREAENRMKAEAWLKSMHRAFKGIHRPAIRFHYINQANRKIRAEQAAKEAQDA